MRKCSNISITIFFHPLQLGFVFERSRVQQLSLRFFSSGKIRSLRKRSLQTLSLVPGVRSIDEPRLYSRPRRDRRRLPQGICENAQTRQGCRLFHCLRSHDSLAAVLVHAHMWKLPLQRLSRWTRLQPRVRDPYRYVFLVWLGFWFSCVDLSFAKSRHVRWSSSLVANTLFLLLPSVVGFLRVCVCASSLL